MAWRLLGTNPLPEPTMINCPLETNLSEQWLISNYYAKHSIKENTF